MEPSVFFSFALTSLIIELTPGPNMAYLAILATGHGRRAGFAAVAGVTAGLFLIGLAAAMGLAAVISGSDLLYQTLRWAGVFYLAWLAWDGWRSASETSTGETDNAAAARYFYRYFYRGLATNLLNPKAALFYVAVLPSFLNPDRSLPAQAVILTCTYVSIATFIHVTIVLLADRARVFLEGKNQIIARRVLSGLLALVALWFAWRSAI